MAIEQDHLDIIQPLLAQHLPAQAFVWAYGSRATGRRVWRGSDLDLIIRATEALGFGVLDMLAEDLSQSLLPYRVDLHDWHRTSAEFLARIRPDLIPFPVARGAPSN